MLLILAHPWLNATWILAAVPSPTPQVFSYGFFALAQLSSEHTLRCGFHVKKKKNKQQYVCTLRVCAHDRGGLRKISGWIAFRNCAKIFGVAYLQCNGANRCCHQFFASRIDMPILCFPWGCLGDHVGEKKKNVVNTARRNFLFLVNGGGMKAVIRVELDVVLVWKLHPFCAKKVVPIPLGWVHTAVFWGGIGRGICAEN